MWVRLPPRAPIFVFCFNLDDALLRKLYEFCTRHLRSDDGIFSPSAGVRTTRPVKLAVPQGDPLRPFPEPIRPASPAQENFPACGFYGQAYMRMGTRRP